MGDGAERRSFWLSALVVLLAAVLLGGAAVIGSALEKARREGLREQEPEAPDWQYSFVSGVGLMEIEPEPGFVYVAETFPEKTMASLNENEGLLLWRLKAFAANGRKVTVVTTAVLKDGSRFSATGTGGERGNGAGTHTLIIGDRRYNSTGWESVKTSGCVTTTCTFDVPVGRIIEGRIIRLENSGGRARTQIEFLVVKNQKYKSLADVGVYASNENFELAVVPTLKNGVLTAELCGINHSPYEFLSYGLGGARCGLETLTREDVRLVSASGDVMEPDGESVLATPWRVPNEPCFNVGDGKRCTLEIPAVAVAGDGFTVSESFASMEDMKNYTGDVVLGACTLHFYTERNEAGSWRLRCKLERTSQVFRAVGLVYGGEKYGDDPHLLDIGLLDDGGNVVEFQLPPEPLEEKLSFEVNVKEVRYALMTDFKFKLT